jgi:hypothetical protein
MAAYRVTCINMPDRFSSHDHITHIGGVFNGKPWKITREEAISFIEAKEHSFYTIDPHSNKRADVGVRRERGKPPFVQTHADGYWNNNLLSLDECAL